MNKRLLFLLFFLSGQSLLAQNYFDENLNCFDARMGMSERNLRKAKGSFPGDSNIDVNYYFLNLNIDPANSFLDGEVQIDFKTIVPDLTTITLDLNSIYDVDSVLLDGSLAVYNHSNDRLQISLPVTLNAPETHSTLVFYNGFSSNGSFGELGLQVTTHGRNQPVVWTLSEPYDAPLWFPCVDNPADKADSCDVWITLPSFYTAVSQGVLTELKDNEDGTNTAKWKHRYPISQYLISIAATNYVEQKQYYHHSATDSMLVIDYLYPEIANDSRLPPLRRNTIDALEIFSEVYGEYPFINEKYGHAMFGFGGGMEHQTISSMGGFSQGLIAHELAHQWFGDKITCKTWRDIWINEGFAEFSSLYFQEKLNGKAAYDEQVAFHMAAAKTVEGTVAIENTASVDAIFEFAKTYQKGSIILHMLRGVLGDDTFFSVLKEYQNTEFAYSAATIEDFKMIAERVTGQDLGYFFEQWLFGTGYPSYTYSWDQLEDNSLLIEINHSGTADTKTFEMPMEMKIYYANGSNEIQTVFIDENKITVQLNALPGIVDSIQLDPNNWILKDLIEIPNSGVLASQKTIFDVRIFPNPSTEVLYFKGEKVKNVMAFSLSGSNMNLPFNESTNALAIQNLAAGKYFLRIKTENGGFIKSFVKR